MAGDFLLRAQEKVTKEKGAPGCLVSARYSPVSLENPGIVPPVQSVRRAKGPLDLLLSPAHPRRRPVLCRHALFLPIDDSEKPVLDNSELTTALLIG